ncbi:MAG: ATP-dependent zinc metalloprotease FtsH [Candidatus Vogelbacteria bacterium]|nr:ATP-dependent zinc metalloprotease FtsH [Candidatus Vogelbacteria bacterium]
MKDGKKGKNNGKKSGKDGQSVAVQFGRQFFVALLLLFVTLSIYDIVVSEIKVIPEISVSQLVSDVKAGLITNISVEGDALTLTYKDGVTKISKKEVETSLSTTFVNYGVTEDNLKNVRIDILNPTGLYFWVVALSPFIFPLIFVFIIFWMISRQVKGSAMQAFSFGQSKARIIEPSDEKQKVLFKDVAGAKEAKEELIEIVDFLKNPKKFLDIGARIPKGVILTGAPGTGKTLLARAVAGEANVPFLYLSGSEFVEMFVGVGASRVRDLFKMAKKIAPSIIFIDEIDAVGRHRGGGMGGGNDEREQTLNQILVEMDGFEPSEKVIVIAATNRPDVLDIALLRPGRFDRRIVIDLPDLKEREAILQIHGVGKPFAEDVNLKVIAERTPGFSGADLANLMNEASILAAREDRTKVSQYDMIRSVEKVMLGPERKSHILSLDEKKITAYHEMGHALVASILSYSDPVHKVSIIARGRAAGYTLKLPLEEKKMKSKKNFLDDIAVSLGGYAAEKMIFGDMTTGASNDIAVATAVARDMVSRFGMSDKIGPVDFGADNGSISPMFPGMKNGLAYSEKFAAELDLEVSRIMNEALARANDVLSSHKSALDNMAVELTKIETLERKEFDDLLILNGIKPKKIEEAPIAGSVNTEV